MSALSTPYTFRRRRIGRAASPPIWTCYEQIHDDEDDVSDSGSESCSEDDEDYARVGAGGAGPESDSGEDSDDVVPNNAPDDPAHDMEMDVDAEGVVAAGDEAQNKALEAQAQKDFKGKQRAIDPEPEVATQQRRHRKKQHRQQTRAYTLRPILTIQRSQGFVWNQDLFVPPYIKDRYVASTSPPNSTGFVSTSVSSTNSALTDYEVEVVEIRVQEGEFDGIIP